MQSLDRLHSASPRTAFTAVGWLLLSQHMAAQGLWGRTEGVLL